MITLAINACALDENSVANVANEVISPGSVVTLTSACGNKVLDISGATQNAGDVAQLWDTNGGANQKFKVVASSDGYVKLVAQHSGKVLDVDGAAKADGTRVHQWNDNGGANQQWKLAQNTAGLYTLEARHAPGMYLDVAAAGTAAGTRVQLWSRNTTCAQQWRVAGAGTTPPPAGAVIFGVNDGSGYDDSLAFNQRVAGVEKQLGLQAARMGMDNVGCERAADACSFANRDNAVDAHLAQGIALHAVIAFRSGVNKGGNENEWAANYGSKCGKIAAHYKAKVRYYIVDNEPDLSYGEGSPAASPALVVKMQKACYQAIKAVDTGILVESSPATSPETGYNRELLANGIGQYADVIGTHMYGGQLDRDAIGTLRGYMSEHGVQKPVGISECGVDPTWYNTEAYKGRYGKDARALWLRDMATYARDKQLHNVMFFSMFSIHGDWEMDQDPLALDALDDIGHGRF